MSTRSHSPWQVTSFYRFLPLPEAQIEQMRARTEAWMEQEQIHGLVIFAPEGVNGTVAGLGESIPKFKGFLHDLLATDHLRFKDSDSGVRPFRRRTVVCREEIVGLKRPDLRPHNEPDAEGGHHLSPKEWHDFLASDQPHIVIDTRNRYETKLGKFRGAIDPDLATFSDWSAYVDSANLPANLPVLMYCTGGIRCEKALLEMRERGFESVYQLRDGILGYLAEFPEGHFEGECFVFDDRVSVGPDLKPTGNFGICPGCGLTSGDRRTCAWCQETYFVCADCDATWPPTCSKTCKDRFERHGPQPDQQVQRK